MPRLNAELCEWAAIVSRKLPSLSASQAWVSALYSFGMVMVHSCGLTSVAVFLATLLGKQENTLRQQLREFTYEGTAKGGAKRQEVVVEACFTGLLSWVISWWDDTDKRLALALDATTFKDVFTVLVISVVSRGCAIPVAWRVLPTQKKEAWKGHWQGFFQIGERSPTPGWSVAGLAGRGIVSSCRGPCQFQETVA